jgi:MarR family transcriptional regulator, organic hydroperoxide resistance regulator
MATTVKRARSKRSQVGGKRRQPVALPSDQLGDTLSFMRLLWAIDHGLRSTSKQMQRRLGITAPQRLVLRLVGRSPGVLPSQLAEQLHLDRGTLTGIIDRLVARELLTRTPDAADGRTTRLGLTQRGRRFDRDRAGTVEHGVSRVLASLPSETIDAAREVMEALIAELEVAASVR